MNLENKQIGSFSMINSRPTLRFAQLIKRYSIQFVYILLLSFSSIGVYADATAPCNNGPGESSTECGTNSTAGDDSTAVGVSADAARSSTAVGLEADATGNASTAVGAFTNATAFFSTAVGVSTGATAVYSTSVGVFAQARSFNSTSLGFSAGLNGGSYVTDSPFSIAIGNGSNIRPASTGAIAIGGDWANAELIGADALGESAIALGFEAKTSANGAIAIGGDLDGDGVGAFAGNVNAIAIGADVTAIAANTVTTGYPILIKDKNTNSASRNLLRMQNQGPVGFRFDDKANGNAWIFRQTANGGFTMDALNTVGLQEVRFSEGGNMKINGTLTQGSSRSNKKAITAVNSDVLLTKVNELPIHQWTYKHEKDSVKHIGPMAEDFYNTFRLGTTAKGISSLDSSGVALAAIQALSAKLVEKDKEILDLKDQINTINEQLTQVEKLKHQLTQLSVLHDSRVVTLTQTN